jgi:hypothetical protein
LLEDPHGGTHGDASKTLRKKKEKKKEKEKEKENQNLNLCKSDPFPRK